MKGCRRSRPFWFVLSFVCRCSGPAKAELRELRGVIGDSSLFRRPACAAVGCLSRASQTGTRPFVLDAGLLACRLRRWEDRRQCRCGAGPSAEEIGDSSEWHFLKPPTGRPAARIGRYLGGGIDRDSSTCLERRGELTGCVPIA